MAATAVLPTLLAVVAPGVVALPRSMPGQVSALQLDVQPLAPAGGAQPPGAALAQLVGTVEDQTQDLDLQASDLIAPGDAVRFGPGGCISTWRSPESHCVLRTDCAEEAASLAAYSLRLVCVGDDGARTSHAFGQGSFEAQETFDTMILCNECTSGEDEIAQAKAEAVALHLRMAGGASAANATKAEEQIRLNATVQGLFAKVAKLKMNILAAQQQLKVMHAMVFTTPAPGSLPQPSELDDSKSSVHFALPHFGGGRPRASQAPQKAATPPLPPPKVVRHVKVVAKAHVGPNAHRGRLRGRAAGPAAARTTAASSQTTAKAVVLPAAPAVPAVVPAAPATPIAPAAHAAPVVLAPAAPATQPPHIAHEDAPTAAPEIQEAAPEPESAAAPAQQLEDVSASVPDVQPDQVAAPPEEGAPEADDAAAPQAQQDAQLPPQDMQQQDEALPAQEAPAADAAPATDEAAAAQQHQDANLDMLTQSYDRTDEDAAVAPPPEQDAQAAVAGPAAVAAQQQQDATLDMLRESYDRTDDPGADERAAAEAGGGPIDLQVDAQEAPAAQSMYLQEAGEPAPAGGVSVGGNFDNDDVY